MRKESSDQPLIRSEVITGAAMLIRRETIEKIGLLPEYHFFGVEDIDYSLGALKAGFGIATATKSKVWHKGSRASTVARIGFHYRGWQIMRRKYLSRPGYIMATFSALTWAIMGSIIPFFRYLYHGDFRELRDFFKKIISALKGIIGGAIWKSRESSGGEGMTGEDSVPKR
jgi:GT2 family glycosyltransferase